MQGVAWGHGGREMDARELGRMIARLRDESAKRQQAMLEMRAEMDKLADELARIRTEESTPMPAEPWYRRLQPPSDLT